MAPRTLPGKGLQAYEASGAPDWNVWTDTNWRIVSAWLQARVNSVVATVPGSPTDGDTHILTDAPNQNSMAVRDNGAWVYLTPQVGHRVYDEATSLVYVFNGSAWVAENAAPITGAAGQKLSVRCVYGGTANAVTLTYGMTALVTGQRVQFRATSANTGATTINLDGLGAVACRTITGAVLPNGYIRTDVDTEACYDGTYWVVQREILRGSSADGTYTQWADGTQLCRHTLTVSDISTAFGTGLFRSPSATWTFPFAFVSAAISYSGMVNADGRWAARGSAVATSSSASFRATSGVTVATPVDILVEASGFWY